MMQQASRRGYDLNKLILDLSGVADGDLEEVGRKYYYDSMLDSALWGNREAHDGENVYFGCNRYSHCCYDDKTGELREDRKARIARLPWVLPVVAGNIETSECIDKRNEGRPNNRAYIVLSHNFVVFLEPNNKGGWKYSTHYPADRDEIRKIQRNGKCIWRF